MELFKPEFGLVFWMLIVFLIILRILAKFAWPVIIRSIEERADFIDSGVKYTQDAVKKLDEAKEQARLLIEDAHKQQVNTLQETERMRQKMIEEAKEAARGEAQKVIDDAHASIEQAKREAELQLKKQVGRLALEVAGKLLRKDLEGDGEQEALVDRILDEMKS
mgnify:FL=1